MTFTGLPRDFFAFFEELAQNNNKLWFKDNKQRYRDNVQEPLLALVEAMGPRLKKISPHIVADPRRNGGSVFRIYKDVRFSKDKSPYKTHGAIQFRHARGKDAHAPGFYIHLSPDEVFAGGGVWGPPSPALLAIRETIRDDPRAWQKIINGKAFVQRFGEIRGDRLTRPPRGFDKDDPMIEDIKRKSFFAMEQKKKSSVHKPEFPDEIEASLREAKPLMAFLCKALDVPF